MGDNLRKSYIDMAKGIGVLMVLFGHCVSGENVFVSWQCSFFMPLFFLCSGMCYTRPKTFSQNARKILVPYYFWGAVGFVISLGLAVLKGNIGLAQLKNLGSYLVGMSMWNYPLWFLVAFFVCKCVFDQIMSISVGNKKPYIQSAAAIIAFTAGLCLAYVRRKYVFFFPFRADIGLTMIPFMLVGYYLKQIVDRLAEVTAYKKLLIAGVLLAVNLVAVRCNTLVSVNSSDYGNPLAFLAGAVSGSCFAIILCQVMDEIALLRRVLSWLGRNSLTIMCTHAIVLLFVSKVALIVNRFVGLKVTLLHLIEFICCTLVMIPVCWIVDLLKRMQKNTKHCQNA